MNPYGIIGVLLLLGLLGATVWRLDVVTDQRDKAESIVEAQRFNNKVEKVYVDKIVTIAGPTVIRDRLVRGLCNVTLPGVPDAAGAAPADADHRLPHGPGGFDSTMLAGDLRNAAINHAKLEALQAELRPQVDEP